MEKRFANKILYQDAFSEESSEDISFIEVDVKQSMIGKNLTELRLPDKFEIVKDIPFSLWGKKRSIRANYWLYCRLSTSK